MKRHEICEQIEDWIDELGKPKYSERNSRTVSFNSMVLRRHYRHLRDELAKLKVPEGLEDLDIPFSAQEKLPNEPKSPSAQLSSSNLATSEAAKSSSSLQSINEETPAPGILSTASITEAIKQQMQYSLQNATNQYLLDPNIIETLQIPFMMSSVDEEESDNDDDPLNIMDTDQQYSDDLKDDILMSNPNDLATLSSLALPQLQAGTLTVLSGNDSDPITLEVKTLPQNTEANMEELMETQSQSDTNDSNTVSHTTTSGSLTNTLTTSSNDGMHCYEDDDLGDISHTDEMDTSYNDS